MSAFVDAGQYLPSNPNPASLILRQYNGRSHHPRRERPTATVDRLSQFAVPLNPVQGLFPDATVNTIVGALVADPPRTAFYTVDALNESSANTTCRCILTPHRSLYFPVPPAVSVRCSTPSISSSLLRTAGFAGYPCDVTGYNGEMKTLKCKDLGGTCDRDISAESWDELVRAMTKHVMETHPDVAKQMEAMHNQDPQKWSKEMKPKWEAAAEV